MDEANWFSIERSSVGCGNVCDLLWRPSWFIFLFPPLLVLVAPPPPSSCCCCCCRFLPFVTEGMPINGKRNERETKGKRRKKMKKEEKEEKEEEGKRGNVRMQMDCRICIGCCYGDH